MPLLACCRRPSARAGEGHCDRAHFRSIFDAGRTGIAAQRSVHAYAQVWWKLLVGCRLWWHLGEPDVLEENQPDGHAVNAAGRAV
eukprot:6812749-Prymnesium_polylepis.3